MAVELSCKETKKEAIYFETMQLFEQLGIFE